MSAAVVLMCRGIQRKGISFCWFYKSVVLSIKSDMVPKKKKQQRLKKHTQKKKKKVTNQRLNINFFPSFQTSAWQ